MFERVYPTENHWHRKGEPRYFKRTGEFRPPKRDEYYLSGAIPEAYRALNDLDTAYHIVVPVAHECAKGHPFALLDIWQGNKITGHRLVRQCDCREV